MRKKNFFAGPSTLPLDVLKELQENMVDYKGNGLSMVETSHRGGMFEEMLDHCLLSFRELMGIPENYDVFFLSGGGTLQFGMIPMNFLLPGTVAEYAVTGSWAKKAYDDAAKVGSVHLFYNGKDNGFTTLPKKEEIHIDPNAAYAYICANETIGGIEWQEFPETGNVPLIADMSSDILTRKVDVSKFGMIYAGSQKNLGPAGATIIILRHDLLEKRNANLVSYLDYSLHAKNKGIYNTPPVFSIWAISLMLDWIKKNGGVEGMEERARIRSGYIYDVLDASSFYRSPVDKTCRSRTNVVFRLPNEDLEKAFVEEAKKEGMIGLKGHRSVGGIRASLYNSLPVEDAKTLSEFMKEFERKNA